MSWASVGISEFGVGHKREKKGLAAAAVGEEEGKGNAVETGI